MTKLIRYLKPYTVSVVLIFSLLFAQAITDLSLPDFMSRIVNVGIQQSGVESDAPVVLRASRFQQILSLIPDPEQTELNSIYQKLDLENMTPAERKTVLEQYPVAEQEVLYEIRPGMSLSETASQSLTQAVVMISLIESEMLSELQLPELTLPLANPAENKQIFQQIQNHLSDFSTQQLNQMASAWLASEYQIIGVDLAAMQRRYILQTGAWMLVVALLGSICAVLVGFFASRMAAGLSRDLRLAVFSHVEQFASAEFNQFSTASLITRTTHDIQQIQMAVVMLMRILFFAPIMGIGGIIKALDTNVSMSWIIVLAVALLLSMMALLFILVIPRFKLIQKLIDRINLITREFLSGLMVIRAFNTQKYEENRFDETNKKLTGINLFVSRLMAAAMPAMMLLMNGTAILIVWFGAKQVDLGRMQVGDMMAFIQYAMQIIMSFLMLSIIFIMLPRAGVSAQRVADVINTPLSIQDPEHPVQFDDNQKGVVTFEHVTFRYPNADEDVLHDISFVASPGQTTAIIGSTGSGKSTLLNLIPRFYDVTGGRITVNGVDVRQISQSALRERIGFVPQRGILFSGTIRENIEYGNPDADEAAIHKAVTTAQAIDFVMESDQQFETAVAQGGSNVSGGQRQRLSIARALVKNPDVYLFDDSFSALDYRTDASLRRALNDYANDATRLIVAQRIATIRHAEQILVLDEGRIVGHGTHEVLLRSCSVYREIAASQLSEKELAL